MTKSLFYKEKILKEFSNEPPQDLEKLHQAISMINASSSKNLGKYVRFLRATQDPHVSLVELIEKFYGIYI